MQKGIQHAVKKSSLAHALLMYIPFALVVGFFFRWRPRLLPYFVIVQILMNMSFAMMFFRVAH